MKIYWMKTALHANAGSLMWSETTRRRKPDPLAERWYPSDSNAIQLGPFPRTLHEHIQTHWALTPSSSVTLPDTFNTLTHEHFTGLPVANKKVTECFKRWAEEKLEAVPVPKMWSLTDGDQISETYMLLNLFAAVDSVDLIATASAFRVVNPKMGQAFSVGTVRAQDVHVRAGVQGERHVWRDGQTSIWLCDDVFREAIDAVTPGTYEFNPVSIS